MRSHAGDVRERRRWLVLVAAPTRVFAGRRSYRTVCYGFAAYRRAMTAPAAINS